MANIDIEKKNKGGKAWIWILVVIIIAGIIWWIAAGDDDEVIQNEGVIEEEPINYKEENPSEDTLLLDEFPVT